MKKVSLLILLVIVASTLLMAAIPTKMVRLTVINKSEYDVYIKLTGSPATDAYYYLTIPVGSRDEPVIKVFTIWADKYTRETWQCGGLKSSGHLLAGQNIRLTFTPCGEMKCGFTPFLRDQEWWDPCTGQRIVFANWVRKRHAGEPTMEKVTYFRILQSGPFYPWHYAYLVSGWWGTGCGSWYYRIRVYRLPYGCNWRYQY